MARKERGETRPNGRTGPWRIAFAWMLVGCTSTAEPALRVTDGGPNDAGPVLCAPETCNAVDDDCDGRVDEALAGGDLCALVGADLTTLPTAPCDATGPEGLSFTEEGSARGVDFVAPWNTEPLRNWHDHEVGGGLAVVDLTGDGSPDIVATAPFGDNALFVNDGSGRFSRRSDSTLEVAPTTTTASAVDLDGDGLREVFLGTHDAVRAYANRGGGLFERGENLWDGAPDERPSFLAWTDFDGDDQVDLYLGVGSGCFHVGELPCYGHDVLMRGQPNGSLASLPGALGTVIDRWGLALAGLWEDLDHDGDLDALAGNDSGGWHTPNRVFANPGAPYAGEAFDEIAGELGLEVGMASMGAAAGDLDADGRLSVAISAVGHVRTFIETAPGEFVEDRVAQTEFPTSLDFRPSAWAVELADLDHDMDLDLIVAWHHLYHPEIWNSGNPDLEIGGVGVAMRPILYERRDGKFVPRPEALSGLPHSWMWHTVAPVDLNHDGALDLVFGSVIGPTGVQMGRCVEGRRFLEVSLVQPGAPGNRDALGARVVVDGGGRRQWRRIGVGSTGAQSAREPVAHFGVAELTEVQLSIEWPDGRRSELGAVSTDQRLVVTRQPSGG